MFVLEQEQIYLSLRGPIVLDLESGANRERAGSETGRRNSNRLLAWNTTH